jgi:hypothetical protein
MQESSVPVISSVAIAEPRNPAQYTFNASDSIEKSKKSELKFDKRESVVFWICLIFNKLLCHHSVAHNDQKNHELKISEYIPEKRICLTRENSKN